LNFSCNSTIFTKKNY